MQWNGKSADGTSLTMLHSDMVLKRQIKVDSKTKVATCSNGKGSKTKLKATSCPLQNANGFAGHVSDFFDYFIHLFHCPNYPGDLCVVVMLYSAAVADYSYSKRQGGSVHHSIQFVFEPLLLYW